MAVVYCAGLFCFLISRFHFLTVVLHFSSRGCSTAKVRKTENEVPCFFACAAYCLVFPRRFFSPNPGMVVAKASLRGGFMHEHNMIDYAISAIRNFLQERPDSADTLEGIHSWWIRWPELEESSMVTQTALERLQARGEVEQIRLGSRVLWRRRR